MSTLNRNRVEVLHQPDKPFLRIIILKRGNYIVSVTRVTFYKCSTCVVLGFQGRSLNLHHVIATCCLGGNVYSKDYSTNQLTGLIL